MAFLWVYALVDSQTEIQMLPDLISMILFLYGLECKQKIILSTNCLQKKKNYYFLVYFFVAAIGMCFWGDGLQSQHKIKFSIQEIGRRCTQITDANNRF